MAAAVEALEAVTTAAVTLGAGLSARRARGTAHCQLPAASRS